MLVWCSANADKSRGVVGAVIGEILPFAVGIAISPLPIIVVILTLLSPRARASGPGFLIGWVAGILIVLVALTFLSTFLPTPQQSNASNPWEGAIKVVLGALLLWLAARQWRKRPRSGETPSLPSWMERVDGFGLGSGFRFGLFLSVVNPKNVILSVSVAVDLGSGGLTPGSTLLIGVIFTLLASSTVLVPVLAYLFAADRLEGALSALHRWLVRENHVIMAVLLIVLGFSAIGRGLEAIWP